MPMPMPMGGKPPMGKPAPLPGDEDSSYIDDIMGQDMEGGEEDILGKESPLESALLDAGFKVSPDQLSQIESILNKPAGAPEAPGAKPPLPGLGGAAKPAPKLGGAVPAGMKPGDLPMR